MIVLGLTGSIGMGKTTCGKFFAYLGVPVHEADEAVHRLIGPGGRAVAAVEAAFPGVTANGAVDRLALGRRVFGDMKALARLEGLLHPLVRADAENFLERQRRLGRRLAVLGIPLLFETGAENRCDLVAVVSAPAFIQRQRVMARPGMTAEKLAAILARQMPDAEKRRQADFIIPSGLGRALTFRVVKAIVAELLSR
jgi:dephospho-CoA kinase